MPAPDLFNLLKKVWNKHGFSSTVTRYALALGAQDSVTGWYAKQHILTFFPDMYIITKTTQFMVLKQGLFFAYDAMGYTKDQDGVAEGDIIAESNGTQWLVVSVCDRNILDEYRYSEVGLRRMPMAVALGAWKKWDGNAGAFNRIVRAIEMNSAGSALKVLYSLSLGTRDSVTGWYAFAWADPVQIKCPILDVNMTVAYLKQGINVTYMHGGYTLDDVFSGDVIRDVGGVWHRVREVKPIQIGDHLVYFALTLEKLSSFQSAQLGIPIVYIPEPTNGNGAYDGGSAYFKRQGEIWVHDPALADGGGYYPGSGGTIGLDDPHGVDALGASNGGAYFDR